MLFLLPLALSFLLHQASSSTNNLNIFLLAGQSNMAGRGGVTNDTATNKLSWDGIVPPQCQPNPDIFRLTSDLAWVEAQEPLHADIDDQKANGIGPGMPFSNAVLTRDPSLGSIGLVPCAVGGTNISEWEKGAFLYSQLVRRATYAKQDGAVYRAMLWYQGESDTESQTDAELYKGRLERFFHDLRSDLQAPSLPIFQVALASGKGPYTDIVREAQMGIGLQNVQTVDAKGLALEPDGLHLTAAAQVKLGEMLAQAFLHSIPSPSINHANSPMPLPFINSTSIGNLLFYSWIFIFLL